MGPHPAGLGMMLQMMLQSRDDDDDDDDEFPDQFRNLKRSRGEAEVVPNKALCRLLPWGDHIKDELVKMGINNAGRCVGCIFPDEKNDMALREFFLSKLGLHATTSPEVLGLSLLLLFLSLVPFHFHNYFYYIFSMLFAKWFPNPNSDVLEEIKNSFVDDKNSIDPRATENFFIMIVLFFRKVLCSLRNENEKGNGNDKD